MRSIVIGARGSVLSRCQTRIVLARLEARWPSRKFSFTAIAALGDQRPNVSLVAQGGEGIFVKELEAALTDGRIDCAVHSLKDLPLATPNGLTLAAITEREDARDAFISRSGQGFDELPAGARIGTSSPRRISQLRHRRQDLKFAEIRGNVDTRLRKVQDGEYDAIVLAACGLIRLGLDARITGYLPFDVMLPEPGQGALAVEARVDDRDTLEMLRGLDHAESRICVEAERAFLGALGGGCRVPIAAHAELRGDEIRLAGVVTAADGSRQLRGSLSASRQEPPAVGERLAAQLRAQGADALLAK